MPEERRVAQDPNDTIVSFGVVMRMPLERISEFKERVSEMGGDCRMVYQRMTPRFLKIEETEEQPGRE